MYPVYHVIMNVPYLHPVYHVVINVPYLHSYTTIDAYPSNPNSCLPEALLLEYQWDAFLQTMALTDSTSKMTYGHSAWSA